MTKAIIKIFAGKCRLIFSNMCATGINCATSELNDEFIKNLHGKTGIDEEEIKRDSFIYQRHGNDD